jgi:alanine-glyoxylate transaminase/serine-glyoxylate transaminase/serine-pyruvate transaminase
MPGKIYPELNIPSRILTSTGPVNVHPRVYKAMMTPVIGYGEAAFLPVIDGISSMLADVFQTKENLTMALSATGSGGVEAGMINLLEPGDTAIIGSYGFFCQRMAEMARRQGANVVEVQGEWAQPLDPDAIRQEAKKHRKVKVIGMVHAETSTGIKQPLEEVSKIAKEHDALFAVDAVTSLAGCEVAVDKWGIDYISSGSQKCLACPPGLSPCAVSNKALNAVKARKQPPFSWYLDLTLIANYWGKDHVYHHTVSMPMLYALYEGLRIVLEEGLEARYARHQRNALALRAGLEAMGLKVISNKDHRLPQITPVEIPAGVDDAKVRGRLVNEFKTEISRGLGKFGGKIWRIGLMGETSTPANVYHVLSALEKILPENGYEVPVGAATSAASKVLAKS